jgi:hypothetical protein
MIMDNPGPAIFKADPDDEFRLSFIILDRREAGGSRTLMTMRCFEEHKLRGAIVWLGEHQHLWPEWQEIAEAEGGNALSAHLVALMMEDSQKRFGSTNYMCELCIGASATRGVGKSNIDLSMILSTRSLSIITHSFNSVRLRDAFMDFLMSEDCTIDRTIRSIELAELALLEGRNVLARKLDAIAKRQVRTNGRTVH